MRTSTPSYAGSRGSSPAGPLSVVGAAAAKGCPFPGDPAGMAPRPSRCRPGRGPLFRPSGATRPAPALWIHGGGYLIGDAAQDDDLQPGLRRPAGHRGGRGELPAGSTAPFPAPVEDCYEALTWLADLPGSRSHPNRHRRRQRRWRPDNRAGLPGPRPGRGQPRAADPVLPHAR